MEDDDDEFLYGPSAANNNTAATASTAPSTSTAITPTIPAVATPPPSVGTHSTHPMVVPGLGASEPGDGSLPADTSGDVKMADGEPEELEEGEEEEEEEEEESDDSVSPLQITQESHRMLMPS